jgi:hypothetical protein
MARLKQQHPRNYVSSGNIHTEFESLIRYLNSAEKGSKTLGELLTILFNEEGTFRGPVEIRVDTVNGMEYRIGTYRSTEEGWLPLISLDDLRGPPGLFGGLVEGPFFFNRRDILINTGVNQVAVVNGGSGYASAPAVTFSAPQDPDGELPVATAVLTGGVVTSVTVNDSGSGYTIAPTVTIAPPGSGTQATATAILAALAPTASEISYYYDSTTTDLAVYKNGLLLREDEYDKVPEENRVDLDSVDLGDKITIYSIRAQSTSNFRRQDTLIAFPTATIVFLHMEDERLLVFRNGILQEEGIGGDFVSSAVSGTVFFLDPAGLQPGETITVITVENLALRRLSGLMDEDRYTDENGFIRWSSLAVENDEIQQNKVNGLVPALNFKANLYVQALTPVSPGTGDLWLDTARTPNLLKFFDGVQWLETSPESTLPTFVQTNANQFVRVNGTGTALEYANIDFSPLVPKTFMGAANGVATLNASGQLVFGQLPDLFATKTISFNSDWITNNESGLSSLLREHTYYAATIWRHRLRINGIAFRTRSGNCSFRLSIDGVPVGNTYNTTNQLASVALPDVIEVDGVTNARRLEIQVLSVTSQSAGLEVGIACATVNV